MTGADILFIVFVMAPAAAGYAWAVWSLTTLFWHIKDYFVTRKAYMQKVLDGEDA